MFTHSFTGADVASLLTGGMSDLILFDRQMDMWETIMRLCLARYDSLEKAWFYAEFIMRGIDV